MLCGIGGLGLAWVSVGWFDKQAKCSRQNVSCGADVSLSSLCVHVMLFGASGKARQRSPTTQSS